MRYQYQGVPSVPVVPSLSIGAGFITAAKAGTKYFWLQYRNRAGYSAVSAIASITVSASQGVVVTIPSIGSLAGVDIQEYVLLMSTTGNVVDAVTIATFPSYQPDGTLYTLPATIQLNRDSHLEVSGLTVSTIADLPTYPVHGMRRAIAATGKLVAYDAVFNPIGWKDANPQVFSTYVSSTVGINGCDISIVDIDNPEVILTTEYGVDGTTSQAIGFWLVNDGSYPVPEGTRIGMAFDLDGIDVSSQFVGLASILFQGYANVSTGSLDTASMIVNTAVPYSGSDTGMILQKNLPVGSAILLQVRVEFRSYQLRNRAIQGSVLRVSPYLYADFARYNPNANLLGSMIFGEYDRRRIVPTLGANSAKGLKGSGAIDLDSGGGYTFEKVSESPVIGLASNTANQNVFLSANGSLYVANSAVSGAMLRAIVGTVNGVGHITPWAGNYALDSNSLLQISASYPQSISPTYPDYIAGSDLGSFNPSVVRVYVRKIGQTSIACFDTVILSGVSQNLTVGIDSVETISSLPSDPSQNFGLYRASEGSYSISVASGTSVFESGNYEVAIAFVYQDRVTSISHSPVDGCVIEVDTTFAGLFERTKYNAPPLANLNSFRVIASTSIPNLQIRVDAYQKDAYLYDNSSFAVDDGTLFSVAIKPSNLAVDQPGRWLKTNRLQVGNITVGRDENDYAIATRFSDGIQYLDITLPRGLQGRRGIQGEKGDTGTFGIGLIEVGLDENDVSGTLTKVDDTQYLNLTIPRGLRGMRGIEGIQGEKGDTGATGPAGVAIMIGSVTVGIDENDYGVEIVNLAGVQTLNMTLPRGTRGHRGFSGEKGDAGSGGSGSGGISSSSSLTIPIAVSVPATASDEIALFNQDNLLKFVGPNNGDINQVAVLGRTQVYTRSQTVTPASIPDATYFDIDGSLSNAFKLNLTNEIAGTRILQNPTNLADGQALKFVVKQSPTGFNPIAFGNKYRFQGNKGVSQVGGSTSVIECLYEGSEDRLHCHVWGGGSLAKKTIAYWAFTEDGTTRYDTLNNLPLTVSGSVPRVAITGLGSGYAAAIEVGVGSLSLSPLPIFDINNFFLGISFLVRFDSFPVYNAANNTAINILEFNQFYLPITPNQEIYLPPISDSFYGSFSTSSTYLIYIEIDKANNSVLLRVNDSVPIISSIIGSTTIPSLLGDIVFGSGAAGPTFNISGLALYNTSLSESEQAQIYNAGTFANISTF